MAAQRKCAAWLAVLVLVASGCSRSPAPPARGGDRGSAEVIIVGAGLSGLALAYELGKAGVDSLILEASPRVGGRIRTPEYADGIRAEAGLEEFWEGNPALEIARELDVPLSRYEGSLSSFRHGDEIHSARGHATDRDFLASFLPAAELEKFYEWDRRMQQLYEVVLRDPHAPDVAGLEKISFGDWVRTTSGMSETAQQFVRVTSEPEYGTSWQRICALDGIVEWQIFSGDGADPYSVKGGNVRLVEVMADAVGRKRILFNKHVTHITATEDGVEVLATDVASYAQYAAHGRFVVTTMPLYRLNDIEFSPPLSLERRQAIATQTWGAYFTAHVFFDRPFAEIAKGALQDVALPLLSDGPLGVLYPTRSGRLLNLLVHGDFAERFNLRTLDPGSIRAEIGAAFDQLSPGLSAHIEETVFYRYHPRAIAGWPVGRSRFDDLSEALRKPQGPVFFAGDFTEGTHSDAAVKSALRVARDIIAAR